MLRSTMIKYTLLLLLALLFSACVNKHGISAKVYSDCDEYYDMQGFYHKKCGDDDIITYKTLFQRKKRPPEGNVW